MTKPMHPDERAALERTKRILAYKKPERIVPSQEKTRLSACITTLPTRNGETVEVVIGLFGPTGMPGPDVRLSLDTWLWLVQDIQRQAVAKLGRQLGEVDPASNHDDLMDGSP
jgi:hypothetical protein